MTGIELWSTTAANNNSAAPNGFPEGMPPSGVNDAARQVMASVRTWYETAEWIDFGHTPTYIGATQFSVPTDLTTTYQVGRRIKAVGTTPFTIYGTITVSAYSSVTTVTVVWDSGSLNSTLTTVSVGMMSITNPSIYFGAVSGLLTAFYAGSGAGGNNNQTIAPSPAITAYVLGQTFLYKVTAANTASVTLNVNGLGAKNVLKSIGGALVALVTGDLVVGQLVMVTYDGTQFVLQSPFSHTHGADVASATTTVLNTVTGNIVDITGTTAITAITLSEGRCIRVRAAGAFTLTHGASLICPSSANIVCAAGDQFDVVGYASGVVRIYNYQRLTGKILIPETDATTQATADNSTKIATTAYVDAAVSAKSTSGKSFTSNTTLADITNLTWALGTGTYVVDFGGYITCNTAGGFKLAGAFSGTASGKMFRAIATDTGGVVVNWPTTATPFSAYGTTGVTQVSVTGQIVFSVSVSGTFSMQLAQNTSNGAATAVADGQFNATVKKVA